MTSLVRLSTRFRLLGQLIRTVCCKHYHQHHVQQSTPARICRSPSSSDWWRRNNRNEKDYLCLPSISGGGSNVPSAFQLYSPHFGLTNSFNLRRSNQLFRRQIGAGPTKLRKKNSPSSLHHHVQKYHCRKWRNRLEKRHLEDMQIVLSRRAYISGEEATSNFSEIIKPDRDVGDAAESYPEGKPSWEQLQHVAMRLSDTVSQSCLKGDPV